MAHNRTSSVFCRASAFTLIELLAVIAIIGILLGLLIPAVSRIRIAADDASTKNEISQISSACHRYYDDFRAYPGPLSNTDIENQTTSPPVVGISDTYWSGSTPILIYGTASHTNSSITMQITASENLVLGLLGGLWRNPSTSGASAGLLQFVNGANPASATIPNSLIGTGPRDLNPLGVTAVNKQYTAYLLSGNAFPGSPFLLNGDGSSEDGINSWHDAGGRVFGDSIVPVFTDQFPDHLPILYMRARVGAKGVISGPFAYTNQSSAGLVEDPSQLPAVAHYNYDLREITPYTLPNASSPNGAGTGTVSSGGLTGVSPLSHGLEGVGGIGYLGTTATSPYPIPFSVVAGQPDPRNNAGLYFLNQAVSNGTTPVAAATSNSTDTVNQYGSPRSKDEFILISAGKDRTYGTGDDDTSFGDVQP